MLKIGRVQNSGNSNSNEENTKDFSSVSASRHTIANGGPPGLGNLFMGGIPKLKPTGLNVGMLKKVFKIILLLCIL